MEDPSTLPISNTNSNSGDYQVSDKLERIEEAAANLFANLDSDRNGYLSKEELQLGKESDAKSRLVAEALLQNYNWISQQSDDQLFKETQITRRDIGSIGAFRDDNDECAEIISRFGRLDFNKDGYLDVHEHNLATSKERDQDIRHFFSAFAHPNLQYYDPTPRHGDPCPGRAAAHEFYREFNRLPWIANLSEDSWFKSGVTLIDLEVFRRGARLVKQMDTLLNSKIP